MLHLFNQILLVLKNAPRVGRTHIFFILVMMNANILERNNLIFN